MRKMVSLFVAGTLIGLAHEVLAIPDAKKSPPKTAETKKSLDATSKKAIKKLREVSFEQTLIEAYKRSPEWAVAIAHKKVADEGLAQAYSRLYPSINGQISFSGSRGDQRVHPAAGPSETEPSSDGSSVSVALNQNLFDGFATTNGILAAEHSILAARSELIDTEQKFFRGVLMAYLGVWEARQRLEIAKKLEENLAYDLRAAQKKFDVGTGTRPEVAAAEAQHADALYRRTAAQAALETALAQFEAVARIKPPEGQIVLPPFPKELPTSEEELKRLAQRWSPALQTARERALVARFSESKERGALLPHVDLSLSAAKSIEKNIDRLDPSRADTNRDTDSTMYRANVTVSVPILANESQRGTTYSASRRANQEALAAELAYQKASLDIMAECIHIWTSFRAAQAQLQQSELFIRSAEIAVEGARQSAQQGLKSQTDVLFFEGKLLESRNSAVEAQKSFILMAYRMLELVGKLTASGLRLAVPQYCVEQNEEFARAPIPFVLE
ncbi:MAG: TolC family protein [Holosporales bacterium]|jgi:outer membrane protein|nr:TolC family protein [Holosporales bacterium]